MTFEELKLHPNLLEGLDAMGFKEATPIQEQAIPAIMDGRDIIACAQTGTGKTAAFLLPVLHRIVTDHEMPDHVNAIILVPTRELAIQIDQQLEGLSYFAPASSAPIYGGGDSMSFETQKKALQHGANVIVATPGRLLAHLSFSYSKLQDLKYFILDEADRMLDMGFYDDIIKVMEKLPKERQNLLFSATMPPKIRQLAAKMLQKPVEVNLAVSKPAEGVLQGAYVVYDNQKLPLIKHLLTGKDLQSVIVFTSRKSSVRDITKELQKAKLNAVGISSDLDQPEREQVLLDFRSRKTQILVATDIMSRGIDIKDIDLVINYDVPGDAEDYVHRVGRTARAKSTGVALTFISPDDQRRFADIERLIEREVHKSPLPEHIGKGPEYDPKASRPRSGGGGGRKGGSGGNRGSGYKGKGRGKGGPRPKS